MECASPQNADTAQDIGSNVTADKLRLLVQQSYPGLYVSFAVAALLTWTLWDFANTSTLTAWITILLLVTVVRFYLYMVHFRTPRDTQDVLRHARPYVATLIGSTLTWGVGALFIMPQDSMLAQAVTMFFLIGMAGGVLATYSAYRPAAIAGMLSILLPSTLWLFSQGDKLHVSMAIGASIFIIVTLRGAKILSDAMHHNFQLGYELKHAYEKADMLANTDVLTCINNRRAFFERGEQITSYCERNRLPLSTILMDVDHFKHINDTQGHHFGDIVLQRIGSTLKSEFRQSDVLGRLGGEEFAVLLPNTSPEKAHALAEQLRQALAKDPVTHQDKQQSITVSIGVASGSYDLETLLPKADAAMYQAKLQGRNRTHIAD